MSARRLGGGRILGSGKGLSTSPVSILSPSVSSSSALRNPVLATSPRAPPSDTSADSHRPSSNLDITYTLIEDDAASSNGNGPGRYNGLSNHNNSTLVCPICSEEMVTLLQLNRHIDDVHQELPEVEQDEVRSWFDKQVLKAKRFQPLSLFAATQRLRGLEVFEANESTPAPSTSSAPTATPSFAASSSSTTTSRILDPPAVADPEDFITRRHWQRCTPTDTCTEPTCGRLLGPLVGNINCRKCGKLFCEQHTMYQMRLSRAANHEPVRGYWARVCETCYKSREGYNDHAGVLKDHTCDFVELRQKRVERQNLDIARLEKRLTKLTRLLANPLPPTEDVNSGSEREGRGGLAALGASALATTSQNKRKALEQRVVAWEDDKAVSRCPLCQQEFGSWSFRRHHCRICGRVVCSDVQTLCSTEVSLTVKVAVAPLCSSATSEKTGNGAVDVGIRICRDCRQTIFSKRDFEDSLTKKPPDQRAYETLRQFEKGIRLLLPTFQRALLPLQQKDDDVPPPSHQQIQEAAKMRKRLIDSFQKYDVAARRIRDLPTTSPTQQKLQNQIYATAGAFLHVNMLPLKSLPRLLKPSSHRNGLTAKRLGIPSALRESSTTSTLPAAGDNSSSVSAAGSETSTAVSALEQEERELRERLVVLEEQRFMVSEMIKKAQGQRRFEEVGALTRNGEELDGEIKSLRRRVGDVEERWAGVYGMRTSNGHGDDVKF